MDIKIKWLGWDSFQIRINKTIIYIDPLFGEFNEEADIVLISHGHRDHCNPEILDKIRNNKTVVLTSKTNKNKVEGIGLVPEESYETHDLRITAVHAYNITRKRDSGEPFHPKGFGVGFIIQHLDKKIYFMGDTDFIPEMKSVKDIDVLLVPISGKFVMNINEAIESIKEIKPKITIPMHYGIVDGSYGGNHIHIELEVNIDEFERKAKDFTEVRILAHNETFEL